MISTTGYKAVAKHLPISPSKVRPIANLVRQQSYVEAEAVLRTLAHKGADLLLKTLHSAAANAMNLNKNIDEESLFVKELRINEGTRHKRMWARGRGRADRQLKRYSHIAVVLSTK